jgi:hypothetical protein
MKSLYTFATEKIIKNMTNNTSNTSNIYNMPLHLATNILNTIIENDNKKYKSDYEVACRKQEDRGFFKMEGVENPLLNNIKVQKFMHHFINKYPNIKLCGLYRRSGDSQYVDNMPKLIKYLINSNNKSIIKLCDNVELHVNCNYENKGIKHSICIASLFLDEMLDVMDVLYHHIAIDSLSNITVSLFNEYQLFIIYNDKHIMVTLNIYEDIYESPIVIEEITDINDIKNLTNSTEIVFTYKC